jgi:hypothetical protein
MQAAPLGSLPYIAHSGWGALRAVCSRFQEQRPPGILAPSNAPMIQPDSSRRLPGAGRWSFLLVLAITGCGHTQPFESRPLDTDQPFAPGPPTQLTLNRGPDREAAWLPDASAVVYSTQPAGRRDRDVCLAVLPPTGGRQRALICDLSPTGSSLTDAIGPAAPATDGRLAFVAATSTIGAELPGTQELALGTLDDPSTRQNLISIPYTVSGGRLHGGISQLHWLGPDRLLYLGESVITQRPCQTCALDTLRSGQDAVVINLNDPTPIPHAVPGTDYASGVSPGSTEDDIYYTLSGDSRVYHQFLSSGAVSVIHDFAAAGIARDVHVVGNRMAAVVGGRVAFGIGPSLGPFQWDSGGTLHVVNLQDGTDVTIDGPGLTRRPRFSPSGAALMAEVYRVTEDAAGAVVEQSGDLYLFGVP